MRQFPSSDSAPDVWMLNVDNVSPLRNDLFVLKGRNFDVFFIYPVIAKSFREIHTVV